MNCFLFSYHSFHAAPMLLHWFLCCCHSFHWHSIGSFVLHTWSYWILAVTIPSIGIPLVPSCCTYGNPLEPFLLSFLPFVFHWFLHAALMVLLDPLLLSFLPLILFMLHQSYYWIFCCHSFHWYSMPSCCTLVLLDSLLLSFLPLIFHWFLHAALMIFHWFLCIIIGLSGILLVPSLHAALMVLLNPLPLSFLPLVFHWFLHASIQIDFHWFPCIIIDLIGIPFANQWYIPLGLCCYYSFHVHFMLYHLLKFNSWNNPTKLKMNVFDLFPIDILILTRWLRWNWYWMIFCSRSTLVIKRV